MKTPLVLLLALSLAGNAVLAVMTLRSANSSVHSAAVSAGGNAPTPGKGGVDALTSASAVPTPAVTAATWAALRPNANLKTLVANLRAAGFPPAVVRAVANQMISEQLGHVGENMPFWKQTPNNPEYLAAQQDQSTKRREMYDDLLGPDARPSAALDPSSRERRYGSLSDDKIDKIEALNRDIGELRTKMYAERKSTDIQSLVSSQAAMEQEQRAELAAILSPAELEQYEMRSSNAANRVMSNLKGVDVTEDEYAALYRAQKTFEASDPMRTTGTFNQESMAARNAAQDTLNEQARAVLTDDRFYEYLKTSDPTYNRAAQFTANYPNITPAVTYQLMQLERGYQTSMMMASRSAGSGGGSPQDRMTQLNAARKDYQDKLNSLLGADVATAYAKRNRNPGNGSITPAVSIGP